MGKVLLYGFMLFLLAWVFQAIGSVLWLVSFVGFNLFPGIQSTAFTIAIALFIISFASLIFELGLMYIIFPRRRVLRIEPFNPLKISVGMTAYNDEGVIGPAVKDFKNAPNVVQVTVIDNNCIDNTAGEARAAGAQVVKEPVQGYGAACLRALKEARQHGNLMVLVEGDQTFDSADLKKLVAYIENADLVVGTRTTAELVTDDSQVNNWFMRYGNIFVAKLIQLCYWDRLRLTDVGCTFRAIRPEAFDKIVDDLKVTGNNFSPHMILVALKKGLKVIEVPVTLKKRAGESKGVGDNIRKGLVNGLQMWAEILLH